MQGLLDALGLPDPETGQGPTTPTKFSAKEFCRAIVRSDEYRRSIYQRVIMGTLPHSIEQMIWDRAEGKVVERMEFEDKTLRLEDAPRVVLERKAQQLNDLIEHLRMNDEMNAALSDQDNSSSSVH